MLDDVSLPFYPSAVNGMTWSKDGELAIAAGEHVYVLVPKLNSSRGQAQSHLPDRPQWDIVRLRVNIFTIDEVGILEPAGSEALSLGEEQSTSTVVSLDWSSPGLGRHRRSILAVLTSNNVLSIWETQSYPNEGRSWHRSLVMNNELAGYFEGFDDLAQQGRPQQDHVARLRRRIRAFSWSFPCHPQTGPESKNRCDAWGVPVLAITNDNNEIMFVQLHSPHFPFSSRRGSWQIKVLSRLQVSHSSNDRPQTNSLLALALRPVRYISQVVWSPWVQDSDGSEKAILAYLLDGRLLFSEIDVQCQVDQVPSLSGYVPLLLNIREPGYLPNTSRYRLKGPLLCHEKLYKNGILFAAATRDSIVTFFIHTHFCGTGQEATFTPTAASGLAGGLMEEATLPQSIVSVSRVSGDVNWDRISCITFEDDATRRAVYLHIITHLTRIESLKYTVHDGTASIERLSTSLVGDQLVEGRAQYVMKHYPQEPAVSRFGRSSPSPTGGHMAILFSLHPGDMPEYITIAKEISTVQFLTFSEAAEPWISKIDEILESLQGSRVSAEALVFQILYYKPNSLDNSLGSKIDGIKGAKIRALSELREALGQKLEQKTLETDTELTVGNELTTQSVVYSRLREIVMLNQQSTTMRLKRLLDHTAFLESITSLPEIVSKDFIPTDSNSDPFTRSLLCRLIEIILEIPNQWVRHSALSRKIKYTAACVATLGLGWSKQRLNLIDRTFDWLAVEGGLDLGEEREHLTWLRDSESPMSAFEYYATHQHSHTLLLKSKDELVPSIARDVFEVCGICGAGIGWDNLAQAQCHNGHTFRRCGLTFLAIQAPGISKYCGLCGMEYLNQDFLLKSDIQYSASVEGADGPRGGAVPDVEKEAGVTSNGARDLDNTESLQSLAHVLFSSCEVCIYCGGKFVG